MNLQGKNSPKKRKFSVDKRDSKVQQKSKNVKLSTKTKTSSTSNGSGKKTSMNLPPQKKTSTNKATPTQTRQKAHSQKPNSKDNATASHAAMNLRKLEDRLDDDAKEYVQSARRGIEQRIQRTKIIAYCAVSGIFLLALIIIFIFNS